MRPGFQTSLALLDRCERKDPRFFASLGMTVEVLARNTTASLGDMAG
jgi:hypothetical protein